MMAQLFLDVKTGGVSKTAGAARLVLLNLVVAIAYAATGFAGLQLAFVGEVVTLFWPPTGIAFAAVWLGGMRLVPGIVLGAFVVNRAVLNADAPAILVAIGNVLPAIVATVVLRRMFAADERPAEFNRVVRFILVAALGSTIISATIGTLVVAGRIAEALQSTWLVWWMGDAMGVLIVAPPVLLWSRMVGEAWHWRSFADALVFAVMGSALIVGLWLIREPVWAVELCKLLTLLLSLWAAMRFGLAGPSLVTLLMATGAVIVTMTGVGPFARNDFHDSFALVHSFLFVTAIAGMLLASALADLKRAVVAERRARAHAETASANRIRLLTMISHDVRTPLAGIIGVLQALDRAPMPGDQQALVGLGLRAGSSLTTLIADILDVARVDAGRIGLQPSAFSPAQAITDVVDLCRPAATEKRLDISVEGLGALPRTIIGDRVRFEQLLGNLVTNAIAYTQTGGIGVRTAVDLEAALALVIEVHDSGPGIDPAALPTLFDGFDLVPRAGSRSAGLGLGLHIARGLTELMGGQIDYRPAHAGGSVFRVALPLLLPMSAIVPGGADVASHPSVAVREPSLSVLLVEDDPIARQVTTVLLERLGHVVTAVTDPDAAVDAAAAHVFDIVLMDLQLGAETEDATSAEMPAAGYRAAERIRALPNAHARVRIIALTSDAHPDCHAACRAAGMEGVIVKPLDVRAGLAAAIAGATVRGG